MKNEKWFLITGVIRSGTTILGKVLSLPIQASYIHEPFNGGYSLRDNEPFRDRYYRISDSCEEKHKYINNLSDLINYRFKLRTHRHDDDSIFRKIAKDIIGSRGPANLTLAKINPFIKFNIIKDPKAILSAHLLYHEFDVLPLIIVRHPVSLAASLQRVGWYPEPKQYLQFPDLIEDYLLDDVHILEKNWSSPILKSMAYWRATYRILLTQADENPDWHIITHEAWCKNPVSSSRSLYDQLGLPWNFLTKYRIQRLTSGGGAEASSGQAMDLNRSSKDIFHLRRNSIPIDLRRRIFDLVKCIALELYSIDSFDI
jgi:hypothetical protein